RKMEDLFLSTQLHIRYVRSLEDSARVRAACVTYLQACVPLFYPERLDIVWQGERKGAALGGRFLIPPPLSWKYALIQRTFGWPMAKRTQLKLRRCRSRIVRAWDGAVC